MNLEKWVTTTDVHVGGETFRILSASLPHPLTSIHEYQPLGKCSEAKGFLLQEPRGHAGMNGCIVLPSATADFGLLFFQQNHLPNFSYSGLVAALTAMLEMGRIQQKESKKYFIETVRGVYVLKAEMHDTSVTRVTIESPLVVVQEKSEEYTLVTVEDRMYAMYPLPENIPAIDVEYLFSLEQWGKEATTLHSDLCGVILYEYLNLEKQVYRSITFTKDGYILRSPGVDSSFALLYVMQEIHPNLFSLTNTSIFGSAFTVKRRNKTRYVIETRGFITGIHQFVYDPEDPFPAGFLLK